jgi:ferredoxin-NADP reductase
MTKLRLRVRAVRALTADIRAFELVAADGGALPPFKAGAHLRVQVTLPDGRPATRHYSLVNAPGTDNHYEIAVLRQPGGRGGSAWMHGTMQVGSLLDAEGPFNAFALAEGATSTVLLAGGIGITPLACMARVLSARGEHATLHYFARSTQAMAYRDELSALPGIELQAWTGLDPVATVQALARCIGEPRPGHHLYACGPGPMLQAALDAAARQSWPSPQVHHERFTADEGRPDDSPFQVELRQSGRRIDVASRQTLLDALLAAGVDAASDCRAGVCGTCLVPVASGQIDHRDSYLSDADRESGDLMCACVSRAHGTLVLDL